MRVGMRVGNALFFGRSGRQPAAGSMRSGLQISQFGVTSGGHLGTRLPTISSDIRAIISAYRTENISDDHPYNGESARGGYGQGP